MNCDKEYFEQKHRLTGTIKDVTDIVSKYDSAVVNAKIYIFEIVSVYKVADDTEITEELQVQSWKNGYHIIVDECNGEKYMIKWRAKLDEQRILDIDLKKIAAGFIILLLSAEAFMRLMRND